ncbi:MAG: FemAB family XrtA/PEP-CTERM system-associated protein [Pseudomonadota bacterium]
MNSTLSVHLAGPDDKDRWDKFVLTHGSFFHRYGWGEVINTTYGHRAIYLYAERNGEIVGVLPLIDRRSCLLGRALISVGFTVGGGIVVNDQDARDALLDRALEEARRCGAQYLELRDTPSVKAMGLGEDTENSIGLVRKDNIYENFSCSLLVDEAARLNAIPRKKRADVRKAIKHAHGGMLMVETGASADTFWQGYATAQRDHGTPVFPRKWLQLQSAAFGDAMEVTLVRDGAGNIPLAGVVTYYHRDVAHLYSAFVSPKARRSHAGDYLYWWMMAHALECGVRIFDLGRSKVGTGSHAYKTYWGMEPHPMVYHYKMLNGAPLPNVNPKNPKFAAFVSAWRRLPRPIANSVGPLLAGHFA